MGAIFTVYATVSKGIRVQLYQLSQISLFASRHSRLAAEQRSDFQWGLDFQRKGPISLSTTLHVVCFDKYQVELPGSTVLTSNLLRNPLGLTRTQRACETWTNKQKEVNRTTSHCEAHAYTHVITETSVTGEPPPLHCAAQVARVQRYPYVHPRAYACIHD